MIHFTIFTVATVLCLAAAGIVSWDLWPLIQPPLADFHAETLAEARARHKLRVRRPAVTANPEGTAPSPAQGAVPATRPHGVPIADTGAMHAVRDELLARNGVRLPDRPRKTVDMIICDPEVTPVVPRYYRAWLEGKWLP